jgi:hypothetical protein
MALLVIAFMAFFSVTLMAQGPDGVPQRTFPDTTNSIYPFSDQIGHTDTMTDAQFQFAATHYVGTQKETTVDARHFREYNPAFLILHYRLGEELGYGVCNAAGVPTDVDPLTIIDTVWVVEWPGDAVVRPQWFYPWDGSPRVYDCGDQHFLMNIADPSWREFYSGQVIKELIDNEDDAVFADSLSVPNYFGPVWTPPLPVIDIPFEDMWANMIHSFTDYMRFRLHGTWLWIPNVGSWVTTRDPTNYTNVDGAMIEGFSDYGNQNFLATADWVTQMDRALSLINLDKILIAEAYPAPWIDSPGGPDVDERLFILGCYLLVKGRHTYVNLDAQGGVLDGLTLQWWPEYEIDLGLPIDPLPADNDITKFWNADWGVYVRHYEHGMVLVNSINASDGVPPAPITLDKTYYEVVNDAGGGAVPANGIPMGTLTYQAVSGLTVCSDCAAILLDHEPGSLP